MLCVKLVLFALSLYFIISCSSDCVNLSIGVLSAEGRCFETVSLIKSSIEVHLAWTILKHGARSVGLDSSRRSRRQRAIFGAAAALEMGFISLHPDKIFMHSIQQTRTGPTSRLKGEPATRELLIKLYPAVFQDKIGCLQGKLALDLLNENATPVQTMARRVPIAMRESLQLELERLARLRFIEKIDEPTEWTSPMIVARKRDGKMRICIDPQALNKA